MKFNFKTDFPSLKSGDKQAFNNLMTDFYAWSIKEACKTFHPRDRERAEDTALAFWEQLPGKLEQFDPQKSKFLSWAATCIRNLAINAIADKPQPDVHYWSDTERVEADEPDPTLRLDALEDVTAISDALPKRKQQVFWRLLEGATVDEIAEEMGVSESRARNIIGHIRRIIREQREE